MLDVNTTKHSSTASTVTATSTTASTEVVDLFDDPLNASDVWLSKFHLMQNVFLAVGSVMLLITHC